jgi:hypothetical protein
MVLSNEANKIVGTWLEYFINWKLARIVFMPKLSQSISGNLGKGEFPVGGNHSSIICRYRINIIGEFVCYHVCYQNLCTDWLDCQ